MKGNRILDGMENKKIIPLNEMTFNSLFEFNKLYVYKNYYIQYCNGYVIIENKNGFYDCFIISSREVKTIKECLKNRINFDIKNK